MESNLTTLFTLYTEQEGSADHRTCRILTINQLVLYLNRFRDKSKFAITEKRTTQNAIISTVTVGNLL